MKEVSSDYNLHKYIATALIFGKTLGLYRVVKSYAKCMRKEI